MQSEQPGVSVSLDTVAEVPLPPRLYTSAGDRVGAFQIDTFCFTVRPRCSSLLTVCASSRHALQRCSCLETFNWHHAQKWSSLYVCRAEPAPSKRMLALDHTTACFSPPGSEPASQRVSVRLDLDHRRDQGACRCRDLRAELPLLVITNWRCAFTFA